MKLFSLFDRSSHTYGAPMMFENEDVMKRTLRIALIQNQLGTTVAAFPEDFEIFCLGIFDNDTGGILSNSEFVMRISDLMPKKEEKDGGKAV